MVHHHGHSKEKKSPSPKVKKRNERHPELRPELVAGTPVPESDLEEVQEEQVTNRALTLMRTRVAAAFIILLGVFTVYGMYSGDKEILGTILKAVAAPATVIVAWLFYHSQRSRRRK